MMNRVWIDWGGGDRTEVQRYEFRSLAELNAFLEGVLAAITAHGLEDVRQFDTEAELDEAFAEGAAHD